MDPFTVYHMGKLRQEEIVKYWTQPQREIAGGRGLRTSLKRLFPARSQQVEDCAPGWKPNHAPDCG